MRRESVYFTTPHHVDVQSDDLPPPAAGQVAVRTICSAISSGTELLVYRGQVPTDLAVDETIPALAGTFQYPLKYGYAAVGRVVSLGPEVDAAWQDRLVFAFTPHESCFLAAVGDLLPVPEGVAPEDAAFLANVETAVNFLMDGRPMIGEVVVVFGQGVVGLLTTALLAQLPLACLFTVDRYPHRREHSRTLGAISLDPASLGAEAGPRARLAERGHDAGADLVYELSGSPKALDQAIATCGFGGRVVVGSWYGEKPATLRLGGRFHRDRIQVVSSQVSTIAPEYTGRWTKSRRLAIAWQMLRAIRPSRLITHRFPVAEAAEAYALLANQPEDVLQVLLTY